MGCSQSKIDNEEAVMRCKNRKLFMKGAVGSRNAFAAGHSSYAMSLKNTGAALSDYAQGEVQNPQFAQQQPNLVVPTSFDIPPPPPPIPDFPTSPLQRAASMPEIKPDLKPKTLGPTIEEGDENEIDNDGSVGALRRRRSSRGGGASGSGSRVGNRERVEEEQGPPPPMPPSPARTPPMTEGRPVLQTQQQDSPWDYFFADPIPALTLSQVEEVNINKEEIERKAFDKKEEKFDGGDAEKRTTGVKDEGPVPVAEKVVEQPPPSVPAGTGKSLKKGKQAGAVVPADGKRVAKSNTNLLQIFVQLDEHFLTASVSAQEVSKMLEATRLHYHSNFADNRGHIDHSTRVMRVITWNRSFRGIPNIDEVKDDFDIEEQETHATVLDKLLAWEKKLYDEVKAGELMKIEYQRKVDALNKLKKRDSNSESLEKMKAAVSHLHTRYIVDMQSMDSTVSEINRLRDEQLYPKLVHLVDGMASMWETMRSHHESQSRIVVALKLLDISQSATETTEHHHERTIQLCGVLEGWHKHFENLVTHQKDYIKALNGWLKLNLVPIESNPKEKVSSPPKVQNPPILGLLRAWDDHLEKLPSENLQTILRNFAAVVRAIMGLQEEEMKLKIKCQDTRKELDRKTKQYDDWRKRYMEKIASADMDPGTEDAGLSHVMADKQLVVEMLRKRLEEEEDAHAKRCRHVREKSLVSLKSHLPELFRVLSSYASASAEMYRDLRSISQYTNSSKSSA